MGVDGDIANVTGEELGEFCQSWILTMKVDGFKWKLVNVYGSTHDDRNR
jgi:hypothetical protein